MSRLIVRSIAVAEPEGRAVSVFILSVFDAAHRRTAGGFLGAKGLVVSCAVRKKAPDGRSRRRLDHSERVSRMRLQTLSSSLFLGFVLFFDCGWFVHLFEEGGLDNAVLMAELVVAPSHAAVSRDS